MYLHLNSLYLLLRTKLLIVPHLISCFQSFSMEGGGHHKKSYTLIMDVKRAQKMAKMSLARHCVVHRDGISICRLFNNAYKWYIFTCYAFISSSSFFSSFWHFHDWIWRFQKKNSFLEIERESLWIKNYLQTNFRRWKVVSQ